MITSICDGCFQVYKLDIRPEDSDALQQLVLEGATGHYVECPKCHYGQVSLDRSDFFTRALEVATMTGAELASALRVAT